MPDLIKRARIGLLFVHGIGEQQRFEHLRQTALQLAELFRRAHPAARVTIVDRTDDKDLQSTDVRPGTPAPVVIHVVEPNTQRSFECHEVWWGDLGTRSGVFDSIAFWLWGLGQWCAPIYRELDLSRTDRSGKPQEAKPGPALSLLPRRIGFGAEFRARLQLLLAGLAVAFIACTWSLVKRLFGALFGAAPSPVLLIQYVGDVRTYEARATPGDTALSDPGHPHRVGIRRRMVSQMVAMGARDYDRWYVAAHSLGTVLAYNGLTEIGHTLPNYLTEAQWDALPAPLRADDGCQKRPPHELASMMPARPPWLGYDDVINRPALFDRLQGFVTYGSPLDKFASLWPRIVSTAVDRKAGTPPPFGPHCLWLNLHQPSDPVSGRLDEFRGALTGSLPRLANVRTPWSWQVGLSHTTYLSGFERSEYHDRERQKCELVTWLMSGRGGRLDPSHPESWDSAPDPGPPHGVVAAMYVGITILLWLATAGLVAWGWIGLFGPDQSDLPWRARACTFLSTWLNFLGPVLAAFIAPVLIGGARRWWAESNLNLRLARADRDAAHGDAQKAAWNDVILMLWINRFLAGHMGRLGVLVVILGLLIDFAVVPMPGWVRGNATAALSLLGTFLSSFAQSLAGIPWERRSKTGTP